MQIVVNGEPRDVPTAATLADLLASLGLSEARNLGLERNGMFVDRDAAASCQVRDVRCASAECFRGGGWCRRGGVLCMQRRESESHARSQRLT